MKTPDLRKPRAGVSLLAQELPGSFRVTANQEPAPNKGYADGDEVAAGDVVDLLARRVMGFTDFCINGHALVKAVASSVLALQYRVLCVGRHHILQPKLQDSRWREGRNGQFGRREA